MHTPPPYGQGSFDSTGGFAPPPMPPPPAGGPGYPPAPGPSRQPPPPRPARSLFRTLFNLSLVLGLLLSLVLNFVLIVGLFGGGDGSERVVSTTLTSGDSTQEVAVVPLVGEIGDAASRKVDHILTHLQDDKHVKAIVLEIDSPGGTVTASDEIYERIKLFKKYRSDKGLPDQIVVSMKSMATSGGYYAACAGDYLYAEPTTMTGNIGVLMPRYNFSGLMQKHGVEETTIVSTGAKYKNAGSPFRPETEQDTKYLQALADAAFTRFKTVVQQGRGSKLNGKPENLFDGRVFVADEAKTAGLIDAIGYPADAYKYAATQAGLSKPMVVRYDEPAPSIFSLLASGKVAPAKASHGNGASLNINGIDIKAGPETLDALRTTRLLYR